FFEEAQVSALRAVDGFDPWTIARRYLCAVELGGALPDLVDSDCLTLRTPLWLPERDFCLGFGLPPTPADRLPQVAQTAPVQPPPEPVGHWARDMDAQYRPIVAAIDVAWHLVIQESFGASAFALAQFALGLAFVLAIDRNRFGGPWPKFFFA